jgi:hypothetical protein
LELKEHRHTRSNESGRPVEKEWLREIARGPLEQREQLRTAADETIAIEVRPGPIPRRLVGDRLRVGEIRSLRHRDDLALRGGRVTAVTPDRHDVSPVEHVTDVGEDPHSPSAGTEHSADEHIECGLTGEALAVGNPDQ